MAFEYDMLYKYHLMNSMNKKNQYNGKNLENVDVEAPLSLFMDREPVTGIDQQFVFAVTIYLVHPISGQILFLRQTKKEKVVDEYVGLGGKARSIFDGHVLKGEKIPTIEALRKSIDFKLKPEDLLAVACKEVMEETLPSMSLADQIILRNKNSNITVSEIRDKLQNFSVVRTKLSLPNQTVILLTQDSLEPNNYQGTVSGFNDKKYFSYPAWKELSVATSEQKHK